MSQRPKCVLNLRYTIKPGSIEPMMVELRKILWDKGGVRADAGLAPVPSGVYEEVQTVRRKGARRVGHPDNRVGRREVVGALRGEQDHGTESRLSAA